MISLNVDRDIAYSDMPRSAVKIDDNILEECAHLFSRCYGVWSSEVKNKSGQPISLTSKRLYLDYLFDDSCRLITAKYQGQLVGHALYTSFLLDDLTVNWITQLVVDNQYRNKKIAQNLISRCISTSTNIIGLCTSNPYAVKALQKAARGRIDSRKIFEYADRLVECSKIPYLKGADLKCAENVSLIDTHFPVDHTDINKCLDKLISENQWHMGTLPDNHEFFAFVFR